MNDNVYESKVLIHSIVIQTMLRCFIICYLFRNSGSTDLEHIFYVWMPVYMNMQVVILYLYLICMSMGSWPEIRVLES